MQNIRKTGAQWRQLGVNPINTDAIRIDNLGNVYSRCAIGEGGRRSWAWRTVTDDTLLTEARSWGTGDFAVAIEWSL